MVILSRKIYYSVGYKAQSQREKVQEQMSGGNHAQESKSPLRSKSIPTSNMLHFRVSAPKVFTGGWSYRHPQVSEFRTPREIQMFSINYIACTISYCYLGKVLCQCRELFTS